jgi:HlyD family secretion protein
MKNNYLKFKQYILKHKKTSIAVAIVLILIIYWLVKLIFPTNTVTTYAVAEVQKGAIVTNVTGSGQVSASSEIDLKTKASGDILRVNVITGQEVKAGKVIAQIDNPSAYLDYRSAQVAYEKFVQPADDSTRIQAENDLNSAKQNLTKSADNLTSAYDTGFTSVASTYLDLTNVMGGVNDLLYSGSGFLTDQNIVSMPNEAKNQKSNAGINFDKIKSKYEDALKVYRASSRASSNDSIDKLIQTTYDVTKELSSILKELKNTVDYIKTHNPNASSNDSGNSNVAANTASNNLTNWIGQINSDLSSLSSSMNSISDLKNTIQNGPQTLAQKQAAYDKVIQGADNLDVEAQRISLQQKQLTYQNLFITAPFDGVIAKINVKPSDSISSGASIGTIITKNKVADITVNEVDAAKIVAGQKASLTFDAISDLTISGVVQSIDLVGTVTQGVVNYNVKITFDVQDDRVKSGMSVSASIVTNNKQDVIVVPNSAVKIKNGIQYVEVFSTNVATSTTPQAVDETPQQLEVTVGLSNDTSTEIVSGLIVGDRIVTKTTSSNTTATKTSSAPSLFGGGGNRSGGIPR